VPFLFLIANALAQTAPVVLTQPQTQTAIVGSNVTFWVTVSSGSGAPPLPSVSSGTLQLWLEANVGVIADSSNQVSQWQDQSGNGNDASQTNTDNQPLLVYPPELGGAAAVRFNGIQDNINGDYLAGAGDVDLTNALTTFTVYNAFATANGQNVVMWLIGLPGTVYGASRANGFYFGDLAFQTWAYGYAAPWSPSTNTYRIWTDRVDTNLTTLEIFDNAPDSSTNFSTAMPDAIAPSAGYYVGGLNPALLYVQGYNFEGDIAELICYQGYLSDSDRLAVLGYLQQKYYLSDVNNNVSYQWQFDNASIPGATNATLTLADVRTNESGSYSVIVTDLEGSTASSNAVLTVNLPPPCAPPQPSLVGWWPANGNADDSVSGNNGTLKNGVTYAPGEVGLAFSFNGQNQYVQIADSPALEPQSVTLECWFDASDATSGGNLISKPLGPGTYDSYQIWLASGNLHGTICNANTAGPLLTYDFTPLPGVWHHVAYSFDSSAQSQTLYLDGSVVASGTANLQIGYDSHPVLIGVDFDHGSIVIPFDGRIDEVSIYNRALTGTEIAAIYNAGISGKCGLPPSIVAQPLSQGTELGSNVTFSVTAGGTPPLAYQWSFNSARILGATNAELNLTNVGSGVAGTYAVSVTNALGSTNSSNAVLSIGLAPTLSVQPQNQSAGLGESVTFSAVSGGTGPLDYQWDFDGAEISNATNSSLTLSGIQSTNSGTYSVVVSSLFGSITSSNAVLTVLTSALQVVSSAANGSATALVPVQLLSAGNENSLYFSLDYNNSLLTYTGAVLGSNATGAILIENTSQTASGRVGLELELPGSATFAIGMQQVAVLNFSVGLLTNEVVTPINFGSQPTAEDVFNAQFTALPATYSNASLTIAATALGGDVFPRTNGNGVVLLNDWIQEGRFVAGLDTVSNTSEFQRADCAPRATSGDGLITVADWVQVGRYAAGFDPPTYVSNRTATGTISNTPSASRILSLAPVAQGRLTNTVNLQLAAQGSENALSCSVAFDPTSLGFLGATLGAGAAGAQLDVNTNQLAAGELGLALALSPGSAIPSGLQSIVQLSFLAIGYSNTVALTLGDVPVPRQVADTNASVLPVNFQNGSLAVAGLAWPLLSVSLSARNVVLSWPAAAAGFTVQKTFSLSQNWTNVVGTPATLGSSLVVTSSISTNAEFFRLKN
jgi:hypothetical protein